MDSLKDQLNKSIKLAHLELPGEEKKKLLFDLEKILSFVQSIKKAEKRGESTFGKNIAPEDREFPQTKKRNALREDIINPFDNRSGIQKIIPQKKGNLIKVKKI
jgi:aspartyl/glutamyl-tRNA(Asn/Gln) amidotransferase C subunit